MKSNTFFLRPAVLLRVAFAGSFLLSSQTMLAQAGGKFFLNPSLRLGIASGYDYAKAFRMDLGHPNRNVGLELRGGYWLNENLSAFTGFGYSSYHYRMAGAPVADGVDTIYTQSQEYWEVPVGLRISTYYGRSVRTRYYAAAGLRACFLSDARHNYTTSDRSASGENVVRTRDFNKFWVRLFAEAGLDIPMDYGSAILIGVNLSSGVSRNTNLDGALGKDSFGVPVLGGCIGLRIGLTAEKPAPRRRLPHGRYR